MTKFHIQLALAILLLMILEIATAIIQATSINIAGCIALVAATYYCLLAAFMWMGAEGVLLCQKVFCVFKKTTTLYLFIVSLVCWSKCLVKQNFHNQLVQIQQCGVFPTLNGRCQSAKSYMLVN